MTNTFLILSIVSSIILFLLAIVCLLFIKYHKGSPLNPFMVAAGIVFIYFSLLYAISSLGFSFYLLKIGVLTQIGEVSLGIIILGIIIMVWKCRYER
jgi:hypothetical protein